MMVYTLVDGHSPEFEIVCQIFFEEFRIYLESNLKLLIFIFVYIFTYSEIFVYLSVLILY